MDDHKPHKESFLVLIPPIAEGCQFLSDIVSKSLDWVPSLEKFIGFQCFVRSQVLYFKRLKIKKMFLPIENLLKVLNVPYLFCIFYQQVNLLI